MTVQPLRPILATHVATNPQIPAETAPTQSLGLSLPDLTPEVVTNDATYQLLTKLDEIGDLATASADQLAEVLKLWAAAGRPILKQR